MQYVVAPHIAIWSLVSTAGLYRLKTCNTCAAASLLLSRMRRGLHNYSGLWHHHIVSLVRDQTKSKISTVCVERWYLQNYKEHEVKAFWDFLQETDSKVVPLGIYGPLKESKEAIDLEWSGEPAPHASQSAAFVIAYQRPRSHWCDVSTCLLSFDRI